MEKIKIFLEERTAGLFLLLVAIAILNILPVGFGQAKLQGKDKAVLGVVQEKISPANNENKVADKKIAAQDLAPKNETKVEGQEAAGSLEDEISLEEEKEGITSSDSNLEESLPESEAASKEETQEKEAEIKKESGPSKAEIYDEIKDELDKYCNKSGSANRQHCEDYCQEAKEQAWKRNSYEKKYKSLRDKYCNKLDFVVGSKKFRMEFEEGETIFDLMERAKKRGDFSFEYKDYGKDLGIMITEINGTKNGKDNKYWMLYVNGKLADKGCSNYKLDNSDEKIEWKREEFSF